MERRVFLQDTAATAVALALPGRALKAEPDLTPVFAQIEKRHDEAVQRLQEWIRQPSIAAENRGVDEGCELTMGCCARRDSVRSRRFPPRVSPASSPRSTPARRARWAC